MNQYPDKQFTVSGTDINEVKRQNAASGLTYNEIKELIARSGVPGSAMYNDEVKKKEPPHMQ